MFGGASIASYNMYKLSEEGEIVEDISESCGEIPGLMGGGVAIAHKERIYAVGWRKMKGQNTLKESRVECECLK